MVARTQLASIDKLFHRPLELIIACSDLLFVGDSIFPESIRGICSQDVVYHAHVSTELVDFRFEQSADGTIVDTTITILGKKSYPIVFDHVACADDS